MKVKVLKSIEILLIGIILISSYFILKQIITEKKQDIEFSELKHIIEKDLQEVDEMQTKVVNENKESLQNVNINLQELYQKNNDIVGWIKINGTNIDYPVMQNGEYYLHKNFYKEYSSYGVPFIASNCSINTSDNLIIYGHHIKNGKMFAQLEHYKNYNFYKEHKKIIFYTLENGQTVKNNYEIVFVFKTIAYSEQGFKYYNYVDFYNEKEFIYYNEQCKNLKLYDTGISLNREDKLITLSTCEYSQKNGRMVVVAKKI